MLYNHIQYLYWATGGVESQHMFEVPALYTASIALGKLQALFPNGAYPNDSALALTYVKDLVGLIPSTMRGVGIDTNSPYTPSPYPNYGLTAQGFGEAHGSISTGFDGGGYGQIIPWLTPKVAELASWDPNIDTVTYNTILSIANTTIDSFDHFLSPLENATVNSNGVVTSDTYGFAEETYITYRDVKNINQYADRFNFNPQYIASDLNGVLQNAYALRSAYLTTQYNLAPSYNTAMPATAPRAAP